ncbi:hypothetical protein HanRHA438_Chr03g0139561 [Helianthus annuus]|nr:hypothetical protein HanRHA438_Chr03g0139561 [Helianthus annuus]
MQLLEGVGSPPRQLGHYSASGRYPPTPRKLTGAPMARQHGNAKVQRIRWGPHVFAPIKSFFF